MHFRKILANTSTTIILLILASSAFSQLRFQSNAERDARDRRSAYRKFISQEGIPVHTGYSLNLNQIKLGPWKRLGVDGAYLDLNGNGDIADSWVIEIPPGKKTLPERHLFEEQVFILSGEGDTIIWQNKKDAPRVKGHWKKGSWFAIPLNAWHEYVNTGTTPVKMAGVTTAPLIIDIYHNIDFVYNCDFNFDDRFKGEADWYDPEIAKNYPYDARHGGMTITNIERNTFMAPMDEFMGNHGVGGRERHFVLGLNAMNSHIEAMQPGTYQMAHFHGPASVIIELSGTGYSLMWPSDAGLRPFESGHGDKVIRADWKEGVMIVPPNRWFHQHFPSGKTVARWVKIGGRIGNELNRIAGGAMMETERFTIKYSEEDPKFMEIFKEELKKNGAELAMPTRDELLEIEREAARSNRGWIHKVTPPKKETPPK